MLNWTYKCLNYMVINVVNYSNHISPLIINFRYVQDFFWKSGIFTGKSLKVNDDDNNNNIFLLPTENLDNNLWHLF